MARRWTGQLTKARVYDVGLVGFSSFAGTACQERVSNGPSKSNPCGSARNFIEEFSAENPPTQLYPHWQVAGMSADQVTQIYWVVYLEVSLVNFAMLKEVLLKISGDTGKGGDKDKNLVSLPQQSWFQIC